MTATNELSRLLDERGVIHGYVEPDCVWWEGEGDGVAYEALEVYVLDEPSGYFAVRDLTPAQAIDATLGRGTCHAIEVPMGMHDDATATVCSACRVAIDELSEMNYCPNCGRRVVE